ncbi:uncharacterized protein BO95DRAFT_431533 [Aspergillus brunneoviolaceus CBS 621.78]|uniref:Uncharacterized protein n=1 Tax=Aspergillus brunneoviolaceus CBS 621.78 TaxID=1450534 RepID=A0ACD1GAT2_9EURO|nr:hypothetical protein BO95DRAFT_431533 [Aspergillus brunneoviolaceus CBS 621.78]RAH46278.1 hypothetical protein BO95DRAFT_431533 [Aspergillus brunneoviolaceus CBS 621.78]
MSSTRYFPKTGKTNITRNGWSMKPHALMTIRSTRARADTPLRRRARGISETELDATEALAKHSYNGECRALSIFSESGYTPVFYGSEELSSDQNPFFRHGHVWAMAMGLADGTSLVDLSDLSYSDKVIIQEEMIKALEYMRLRGWGWYMPETEQIFYDHTRRSVSIVVLSRAVIDDDDCSAPPPEDRITRDHPEFISFGINWRMWGISMPEIWAKSLIIAKSWHLFSVDRHTHHVLVVNSMPLEKGDFCLTVILHIIASQANESNFKGPSESLPATLP